MNKILLSIGGVINLAIGLLHFTLGKAMNWSETLSCLTLDNRATVHTLNIHVAFTCLVFAYLSLIHRRTLLTTSIGRSLTALIGLYWILRAVNQIIYNGLAASDTPFWVILCLLVSLLYWVPTLASRPATAPSDVSSRRVI